MNNKIKILIAVVFGLGLVGLVNAVTSYTGVFIGSDGDMQYCEIWVGDNAVAQSINNGATYTKLTAYDTDGQSSGTACTNDVANDKIILNTPGIYKVTSSVNASAGTANLTWFGAAFLNGVEQDQVHWQRKISTANDSGSASMTGFINATTTPVDLDARARHSGGAAADFTLQYSNLNAVYVGQ